VDFNSPIDRHVAELTITYYAKSTIRSAWLSAYRNNIHSRTCVHIDCCTRPYTDDRPNIHSDNSPHTNVYSDANSDTYTSLGRNVHSSFYRWNPRCLNTEFLQWNGTGHGERDWASRRTEMVGCILYLHGFFRQSAQSS